MNLIGLIVSYVYIFGVIFSAKLVEKHGTEAARKYIHIMLSNWWFIVMIFFDNVIWACIGPASFVVINYISYKKNLIAIMERTDQEKDGLGTVYYALTLLILTIATYGFGVSPLVALAGILVMGYGDGFAAVIGKKVKSKVYHIGKGKKSVAGSITMYIFSLIIFGVLFLILGTSYWWIKAIGLAILMTAVEAVSIKGTDNLTVPLLASLLFGLMI